MVRIERILFPTDFSPSAERAFDFALLMAREFGAELHMLHAQVLNEDDPHDPAHHLPDSEVVRLRLDELADAAMAELVASRGDSGVEIRRLKRRGVDVATSILTFAEQSNTDLIVMGTHGRRGPGRFLLGSVAEKVVRHAECPVLTAQAAKEGSAPASINRILVPMDLSEHSRLALGVAEELVRRFEARVELLHVVEQPRYPSPYGRTSAAEVERTMEKATAAFDMYVSDLVGGGPGPEKCLTTAPSAAPEIVKMARDRGADLIILTTHGRSGLEQFLLGSTAERVVQLSSVPVLVLRSFGKWLPAQTVRAS